MKYLMMMNGTVAQWKSEGIGSWPPQEMQAHIHFLQQFNKELRASGELLGVEALTSPDTTRIVRAKQGGAPTISDGPFSESKEFLAGFWMIDVASEERAYELAARASAAPGRGGKPLNMPIELRQVMQMHCDDM